MEVCLRLHSGERCEVGYGQSGEGAQMMPRPGEQIRLLVDREENVVAVFSEQLLYEP